jgi:hypothetical protein
MSTRPIRKIRVIKKVDPRYNGMVTLDSPVFPEDEARNREFENERPTAKPGYNFVLPTGEPSARDVHEAVAGSFGPKPSADYSSLSAPAIGRLNAMAQTGDGPNRTVVAGHTPKQIIASGGKLGRISIAENPAANGDAPWHYGPGFQEVTANEKHIADSSAEYGVDPDLLRAIIWVESTQGWYDRPFVPFDANKSIRPANINTDYWGNTWGSREALKNPANNIAAGARMLGAISTAMPHASLASRATIYQKSQADKVSDYGARVQKIYEQKPWKNREPRFSEPWTFAPWP